MQKLWSQLTLYFDDDVLRLVELGVIEWKGSDTLSLTEKARRLLKPGTPLSEPQKLERQKLVERVFHPPKREDRIGYS